LSNKQSCTKCQTKINVSLHSNSVRCRRCSVFLNLRFLVRCNCNSLGFISLFFHLFLSVFCGGFFYRNMKKCKWNTSWHFFLLIHPAKILSFSKPFFPFNLFFPGRIFIQRPSISLTSFIVCFWNCTQAHKREIRNHTNTQTRKHFFSFVEYFVHSHTYLSWLENQRQKDNNNTRNEQHTTSTEILLKKRFSWLSAKSLFLLFILTLSLFFVKLGILFEKKTFL